MALNTVNTNRLSTNVKTSNLGTELKGKVGKSKNIIINGAMQVAQRGTSSTSSGYHTVDRFQVAYTGTDEAPTQAQVDVASGTTPYTSGFRKALKITNGNQTGGAGAADTIQIVHKIEAQDIATSGWNYTSASSYITLSFWVKSSVAQEFHGFLLTNDGSAQLYSFSTGSLSADTWTKVTKTIPGNSNLTFNTDNGEGINLRITQFTGTDKTGTITQNQWAAFNTSIRYPNYTSTWYTTNDATFELTGVQLEAGSVATDFEHRSFGEELLRCQRYFQIFAAPNGEYTRFGLAAASASNSVRIPIHHIVEMRSKATFSYVGGNGDYQMPGSSNGFNISQVIVENNTGSARSTVLQNGYVSVTAYQVFQFSANGQSNNAALLFSAEL